MFKRRIKKGIAAIAAVGILLGMTACGTGGNTGGSTENSTIIIKNAAAYTADKDRSTADTVVVKDGRIQYAGDEAGASKFQEEDSKVIDAGGNTVIPGSVDSHMHPAQSALSYYFEIGLQEALTEKEYVKAVKEFVAEHPDNEVYTGSGFMRSVFDKTGPRKESLDQVVSDKPVMLTSADGHSMWVNSKALELAGITKDTKDPSNGVIQRDPKTGEPAGLLQESAMELVADLKPEYTKEEYKEAITWLQKWLNERGITTVFDAMIPINNENYYMAYQEMAEAGELTIHVRGAWHLAPEMGNQEKLMKLVDQGIEQSKSFTTDDFQVNTFKFFADQVLEEETAYLSRAYEARKKDGWKGMKTWDDDVMEALFTKIDKVGYQIHVHQIGDAAATYTLDVLEKVRKTNGEKDSRHTFAHVQFMNEKDMDRMKKLNINAVIAPYWSVMDDYYWDLYVPAIGQKRADNMYPAQTLVDKGINVATHSDFFVTEPDLGWLFYSAVTRTLPQKIFDQWYEGMDLKRTTDIKAKGDYLIGPLKPYDERMKLEDIVQSATYNGAYSMFMEDQVGSIEEGKIADLVILDRNIFDIDIEEVSELTPVTTIVNGKIVYEKSAEK